MIAGEIHLAGWHSCGRAEPRPSDGNTDGLSDYRVVFFTILPSFITNEMRSVAVMSVVGMAMNVGELAFLQRADFLRGAEQIGIH